MTAEPPGPMTPLVYRVAARHDETGDTTTLHLEPVGEAIAAPQPGQFTMLWAFGVGEAPISLAGRAGDRLIHTIRRVGAVTTALADLAVGQQLGVRGPFGTGWDLESARGGDVAVVAGGLGLAPVWPLIAELVGRRQDHGRIAVLVGARSPEELLYRGELAQLQADTTLDLAVEVTVDAAPPAWRGHVGLVTQLLPAAPLRWPDTTVFVCGPEIMMRFVARAAVGLGARPAAVQVSLERNMHCAVGHCGHCQLGPAFVCIDGPVLPWSRVEPLLAVTGR